MAEQDGANVSALPPGGATLVDLVRAADEAALAGDLHRVRRLLAEIAARMKRAGALADSEC